VEVPLERLSLPLLNVVTLPQHHFTGAPRKKKSERLFRPPFTRAKELPVFFLKKRLYHLLSGTSGSALPANVQFKEIQELGNSEFTALSFD